mmetsp:Transcript_54780/g.120121  ORF Transcript_54780/g.120121 Transcript_54780/m.120121 type:complete len:340 (+) Transcript_54780:1248-2267(+)
MQPRHHPQLAELKLGFVHCSAVFCCVGERGEQGEFHSPEMPCAQSPRRHPIAESQIVQCGRSAPKARIRKRGCQQGVLKDLSHSAELQVLPHHVADPVHRGPAARLPRPPRLKHHRQNRFLVCFAVLEAFHRSILHLLEISQPDLHDTSAIALRPTEVLEGVDAHSHIALGLSHQSVQSRHVHPKPLFGADLLQPVADLQWLRWRDLNHLSPLPQWLQHSGLEVVGDADNGTADGQALRAGLGLGLTVKDTANNADRAGGGAVNLIQDEHTGLHRGIPQLLPSVMGRAHSLYPCEHGVRGPVVRGVALRGEVPGVAGGDVGEGGLADAGFTTDQEDLGL